jgi:nitrogen regulatory protein PII
LICNDKLVDKALEIIISKSKTGEVGDGKIFIIPMEDTIRIRTEESGEGAL